MESRACARVLPLFVETHLPSTSTLPEPSNPPQNPAEASSNNWDRMQTEVKALQQQAQATQQSLKKLQTRESASPYSAIVSDLPGFFSGVDSTMLGAGSALALATVAVWWYVWHRPQTRWIDALAAKVPKVPPVSTRAPLSEHGFSLHAPSSTQPPVLAPHDDALASDDPIAVSGDTTPPLESGHSPFARQEPNMEFDPEAAASEVTRVRKYLAEKRGARAQLHDRDDSSHAELDLDLDLPDTPASSHDKSPSVRALLDGEVATNAFEAPEPNKTPASDLDLDLDLGPWEEQKQRSPVHEPSPPADEEVSFSLVNDDRDGDGHRQVESVSESESMPEPQPDPDPFLALLPLSELATAPEPEPEPALVPTPTPIPDMEPAFGLAPEAQDFDSKGYDFTITLALAHESAGLELWNEARDLASEVLQSDDPTLVSEALTLLEQLNRIELEASADMPPTKGAR